MHNINPSPHNPKSPAIQPSENTAARKSKSPAASTVIQESTSPAIEHVSNPAVHQVSSWFHRPTDFPVHRTPQRSIDRPIHKLIVRLTDKMIDWRTDSLKLWRTGKTKPDQTGSVLGSFSGWVIHWLAHGRPLEMEVPRPSVWNGGRRFKKGVVNNDKVRILMDDVRISQVTIEYRNYRCVFHVLALTFAWNFVWHILQNVSLRIRSRTLTAIALFEKVSLRLRKKSLFALTELALWLNELVLLAKWIKTFRNL